jgi:hypothetical protein
LNRLDFYDNQANFEDHNIRQTPTIHAPASLRTGEMLRQDDLVRQAERLGDHSSSRRLRHSGGYLFGWRGRFWEHERTRYCGDLQGVLESEGEMTAREWASKSMSRFKHAAFDPVSMDALEVATEQAIDAAVKEEREACAKIAEQCSILDWRGGSNGSAKMTAENIANAIRMRGQS